MVELAILLTVLVPLILSLAWPGGLALATLLTGTLPMTLGSEGMMVTVFGRLDLYAIRVLGLWVASLLVILPNLREVAEYGLRYRWHVIFLAFSAVALLWAPSLVYGTRMIAKLTTPFFFLAVILVVSPSWQSLKRVQATMMASGILALAVSLASVAGGYGVVSSQLGLGVPGLGPAATSANLAILAMLALAIVRTSPSWSMAALLVVFAGATVAGFTRITIVGLFLGATAILWTSTGGWFRWALPLAGFGSLSSIFLLSDTFRQRMFKDGAGMSVDLLISEPVAALENVHGSGRFEAWSYVLSTFFQPNPVFGSGIGTTQHYFYTHATGLNVIHSEYIRLLAEVGVVGVLLLCAAAGAYMIRLVRTYRSAKTREGQAYSLAGLGALVVYLVFMATDNAIDYVTSCGIFVFALIGMSEKTRELEERWPQERRAAAPAAPLDISSPARPLVSRLSGHFPLVP